MNLNYSQSSGLITDDDGTIVAQGFSGNDSRPGVNPEHIHGYNNPDAQEIHGIGPIPRAVWTVGIWCTHPVLGDFSASLTPVPDTGDTFGRTGFFIHGPGTDLLNSSEGCIVVPHPQRLAVMALQPDTITVTA